MEELGDGKGVIKRLLSEAVRKTSFKCESPGLSSQNATVGYPFTMSSIEAGGSQNPYERLGS